MVLRDAIDRSGDPSGRPTGAQAASRRDRCATCVRCGMHIAGRLTTSQWHSGVCEDPAESGGSLPKSPILLGYIAQVAVAPVTICGHDAACSLNTTRRIVSHITEARGRVNAVQETHSAGDLAALPPCAPAAGRRRSPRTPGSAQFGRCHCANVTRQSPSSFISVTSKSWICAARLQASLAAASLPSMPTVTFTRASAVLGNST